MHSNDTADTTNETDRTDDYRRRDYLRATAGVAAASAVGLAGCMGSAEATGTLATQVTDQPGDIGDFESCVVTIRGFWVKPHDGSDEDDDSDDAGGGETGDGGDARDGGGDAGGRDAGNGSEAATGGDDGGESGDESDDGSPDDADVDESDAREYHEFDEPQTADLVDLQGENTQLIDERDLVAREYAFLQLDVTDVEAVLEDGGEASVSTPGNAPLQFKEPFEIRDGQVTTFVGDFTPVRRGQTDRYLLQPVAQGTRVIYEESAE